MCKSEYFRVLYNIFCRCATRDKRSHEFFSPYMIYRCVRPTDKNESAVHIVRAVLWFRFLRVAYQHLDVFSYNELSYKINLMCNDI